MADKRARRSEKRTGDRAQAEDAGLAQVPGPAVERSDGPSGKLAGVNLHLDRKGLAEEGVPPDTPVTIDLTRKSRSNSALNLILEPLHLSYVIKDEVLKITSEQLRDGEVYTVTYNVADLVIPIPNFVPNSRMGLAGALDDAHGQRRAGGSFVDVGMGGPSAVAGQSRRHRRPAA